MALQWVETFIIMAFGFAFLEHFFEDSDWDLLAEVARVLMILSIIGVLGAGIGMVWGV